MITLDPSATAPRWVDLGELGNGVRLHVLPITTEVMMQARREVRRGMPDAPEGAVDAGESVDPTGFEMSVAVARRVVLAWEGVGGPDGEPAPVTPENICALLQNWQLWQAWALHVAAPALGLLSEKNASAPSPNSSAAGATATATAARRPARPARSKSSGR